MDCHGAEINGKSLNKGFTAGEVTLHMAGHNKNLMIIGHLNQDLLNQNNFYKKLYFDNIIYTFETHWVWRIQLIII